MLKTLHRKADYINRLKNTSIGEILYRGKRAIRVKYFERASLSEKAFIQVPEIGLSVLRRLRLPLILNSNGSSVCLQDVPDFSGFEAQSRTVFFSNIQFDDQVPDIRSVWEPARLQSITAQLFSGNKFDAKGADVMSKEQGLSWVESNPFLYGVHYLSPMECGLRIPVFFFLLKTLDSRVDQEGIKTILSALYCHTWWISKNLALYSSLGNHTVCECVGLIFGGAVFQQTKQGRKWISKGTRLLEQELNHQILEDGGPAEQSLSYHRFVLDLYWLVVDFMESNALYGCNSWKDRLRQGETFIRAFCFDRQYFPSIGDSDDGYAIAPGLIPKRQINASVILSNNENLFCKIFPESGYTVIRNKEDLFILLDHGSLGMAPLYNHGHADALSVILSKKGRPFFIDPGTYRYNGVPEHRSYFRGTRAHNTVCIDGKDQAEQVTGFVWDKPFTSELLDVQTDSGQIFIRASHDGYRRLKNMVIHQRELFVYDNTCCLIVDSFCGQGVHKFELNFHLHPDANVEKQDKWLVLENNGESIFIYDSENKFSVVNGQENPLLGWYSPVYGVLKKTNTLQSVAASAPEDMCFITLICFNETSLSKAIQTREEYLEN